MSRTVIVGWYGHGNLGDELMLERLGRIVAEETGEAPVVISDRPDGIKRWRAVRRGPWHSLPHAAGSRSFGLAPWARGWLEHRARFRASVPAGGTLIFGGGTLLSGPAPNLEGAARQLELARKRRCRVVMFGIGIGRIACAAERVWLGRALQTADHIFVRDARSASLVRAHPAARVLRHSVDMLYGLPSSPRRGQPIRRCVALLPRFSGSDRDNAVRTFADVARSLRADGVSVKVVPVCAELDARVCADIGRAAGLPVAAVPQTREDFAQVLADVTSAIVTPLHALLLAVMEDVPCLPLSYHTKCLEMSSELGIADTCIDTERSGIPDTRRLLRALARAEESHEARREDIRLRLAGLRRRALDDENELRSLLHRG